MTEFGTGEIRRIHEWDQQQSQDIELLFDFTNHPADSHFENLARQLEHLASRMKITRRKDTNTAGRKQLPGIVINDRIRYSALPYAKALPSFLAALSGRQAEPDDKIRQMVEKIEIPLELKLYVAPACPHCPAMVDTLLSMTADCPQISLHIVDGTLFEESAANDRVMSVPCLIRDDGFQWTGTADAIDICSMIVDRDLSGLSTHALKTVLEQGKAGWIAEQMMAKNKIFQGFFGLLVHETWSVRLGAIVVVETLAEQHPVLAEKLCPFLLAQFSQSDVTVQGDILYALGEAGNRAVRDHILEIMETVDNEAVRQAAQEAVETIDSRC